MFLNTGKRLSTFLFWIHFNNILSTSVKFNNAERTLPHRVYEKGDIKTITKKWELYIQ